MGPIKNKPLRMFIKILGGLYKKNKGLTLHLIFVLFEVKKYRVDRIQISSKLNI